MAESLTAYHLFVFVPGSDWHMTAVRCVSVGSAMQDMKDFAAKLPGWTQCHVYIAPVAVGFAPTTDSVIWSK